MPGRGPRLARRDEGANRQYSPEEHRRQAGCPAREVSSHLLDTTLGHRRGNLRHQQDTQHSIRSHHRLRASSSRMMSSNTSKGAAPMTARPLMNTVGVEDTPYC